MTFVISRASSTDCGTSLNVNSDILGQAGVLAALLDEEGVSWAKADAK